jgi:hypothetical protein
MGIRKPDAPTKCLFSVPFGVIVSKRTREATLALTRAFQHANIIIVERVWIISPISYLIASHPKGVADRGKCFQDSFRRCKNACKQASKSHGARHLARFDATETEAAVLRANEGNLESRNSKTTFASSIRRPPARPGRNPAAPAYPARAPG